MINFFSDDDLKTLLSTISTVKGGKDTLDKIANVQVPQETVVDSVITESSNPIDDRPKEEQKADEDDADLYSIKNFSL